MVLFLLCSQLWDEELDGDLRHMGVQNRSSVLYITPDLPQPYGHISRT